MPKLTKNLGQVTIIPGIPGTPATPAQLVPGGLHSVVTPGYWEVPSPRGEYKTLPAHWEYTTYRTVPNPNFTFGMGYSSEVNSAIPVYIQIPNTDGPKVWVPAEQYFYPYPLIWHNATTRVEQAPDTFIPARAAVPGTPDRIFMEDTDGWNSWARSINPVPAGSFFAFKAAPGARGIFCGLGIKSLLGQGLNTFPHAVSADAAGIGIYENGVKVKTLRGSYSGISDIRIVRQPDQSVIYLINTGTETLVYESLVKASIAPLYGHCYLYSGGDSLLDSAITVGQIQFGSA